MAANLLQIFVAVAATNCVSSFVVNQQKWQNVQQNNNGWLSTSCFNYRALCVEKNGH